eukprot:1521342-Amphidinium_carterae.2
MPADKAAQQPTKRMQGAREQALAAELEACTCPVVPTCVFSDLSAEAQSMSLPVPTVPVIPFGQPPGRTRRKVRSGRLLENSSQLLALCSESL